MANTPYTLEQYEKALGYALEAEDYAAAQDLRQKIFALEREQSQAYKPMTFKSAGEEIREGARKSWETLSTTIPKISREYREGQYDFAGTGGQRQLLAAGLGLGEAVLPAAGQLIGPVLKSGASLATPDFIEEPVVNTAVETFKSAVELISNTDWAIPALELAQKTAQGYAEWKEQNPVRARSLESAFDVGLMASPATKVSPLTETLESTGGKLIRSGTAIEKRNRRERVTDMLEPYDIFEAEKAGKGQVSTTGGVFEKVVYVPGDFQRQMGMVVSAIPKVDPNRPYAYNANVLKEASYKQSADLDNAIIKQGNPAVNSERIVATLERQLEEMLEDASFVGNEASVRRNVNRAIKFILANDSTAVGLLNARKQLDRWYNDNSPAVFDADFENSKAAANRIIRQLINDEVADVVPNIDVKQKLRRNHLILTGVDTLDTKKKHQELTSFSRILATLQDKTGVFLPRSPLSIAATAGSAAAVAATPYAAWIGAGGAAVGSAYLLNALRKSPSARKGLGSILVGLNKAIKTAEGPLLEQLKADRLVLIAMIEETKNNEQQDTKE